MSHKNERQPLLSRPHQSSYILSPLLSISAVTDMPIPMAAQETIHVKDDSPNENARELDLREMPAVIFFQPPAPEDAEFPRMLRSVDSAHLVSFAKRP